VLDRHNGGASRILELVRHANYLSGFTLSLFRKKQTLPPSTETHWEIAGINAASSQFGIFRSHFLAEILDRTEKSGAPQVSRSPEGLYCFAVPVKDGDLMACIAGCGVRDPAIDLLTVEKMAHEAGTDPVALLEKIDAFQIATFGMVSEIAARVMALVHLFSAGDARGSSFAHDSERLRLVGEISSELDQTPNHDDTIALLCESLGLIFDLSGTALIRFSSGAWEIEPFNGISFEKSGIPESRALPLVSTLKPLQLSPHDLAELLPSAAGMWGAVIPLNACGRNFGAILLLGYRIAAKDLLLQNLLAGRGALRLAALEREQELLERSRRSEQMFEVFNRLATIDDLSELSREFLEMAAELASARSGSLMLLDSQRDRLNIAAIKGMNPILARNLTLKVGSGIAGKVAKSGKPVMVDNILNDSRFLVGRRARFKTGSFLSIPLCWKGETLGVLNLSDRSDGLPFAQSDLDSLSALANYTASLVSRAITSEGTRDLERLSITDPLTELYNRRFLERRMEEELARSSRHGLKLSIMMLDLDSFKLYNDLCGHQAGDIALKKVSDVFRRSVREMDIVTRYGGEEFCILLPDTPKIDAMFVAERIRYGIEHELFPGGERLPLGCMTVSIGISSFPDNGSSANDLIASADAALYQAKSAGRNKIIVSSDIPGIKESRSFNFIGSLHTH